MVETPIETPIVEIRKLIRSGKMVIAVLPKRWLEENQIVAGDSIISVSNGNLTFMKLTDENKKLLSKKLKLTGENKEIISEELQGGEE